VNRWALALTMVIIIAWVGFKLVGELYLTHKLVKPVAKC